MAQSSGVWCKTINHESQHLIVNGEAVCKTAKRERWASWQLLGADELDTTKQCCRCKHHAQERAAKMREIGKIGGAVRSARKARAARRREQMKRKHKRALVVPR